MCMQVEHQPNGEGMINKSLTCPYQTLMDCFSIKKINTKPKTLVFTLLLQTKIEW